MTNYFELKIDINPNLEEIVADICFSNFDCEGVLLEEETFGEWEVQTSTTKGTLKVFLTSIPQNFEEILQTEKSILKSRGFSEEELGTWKVTLDEKENQDWSKKWKENWTVTHVTDKIAVIPSWLEYTPKENEITITLDPQCAFGTGTHATTQLCMIALEKYLEKNSTMADIGTGSGILAILAKKLGAKSAYGCDLDETVIPVCIENAKLNNEDCIFELKTADKLNEKYDFICANILHFVLAEIMSDLKNLMKPNAKLSLSGILIEKKDIVIEAINKHNLKIIDILEQNEWISYVVTL